MVKIWFYDSLSWTKKNGQVIPMAEPFVIYANTRLVHNYIPPVITEDTWNGQTFPVQIDNWDGYQIQLAVKEIASNMLSKLQACKHITIQEIETGERIELDTRASNSITIEPLGRQGTVNQAFILNLKSERVSSYPALPELFTNQLQITLDSLIYNFHTDFDVISFTGDAEKVNYSYDSGLLLTAKTTAKEGKRLVFYYMETEAISLKNKVEFAQEGDIELNPGSDNIKNIETGKCTITALTEGLFKCEVEIITTVIVKYNEESATLVGIIPNEDQTFVVFEDDELVNFD